MNNNGEGGYDQNNFSQLYSWKNRLGGGGKGVYRDNKGKKSNHCTYKKQKQKENKKGRMPQARFGKSHLWCVRNRCIQKYFLAKKNSK